MTIPHLAFVGYSGSGKTTLVSEVVKQLKQKGYRVGVLKHDAHDFQMDAEGKDTYRYSEAGADIIAISSSTKLNILEQLEKPLELEDILARMHEADIILIEGYKQAKVEKILVARTLEQLGLFTQLDGIIAIASTLDSTSSEVRDLIKQDMPLPYLNLNEIEAATSFVENWLQGKL